MVFSHQPHDARHPPFAGHDNSAGHPAALVVVRPGLVAAERLADRLTVGVAAATLAAAHALVVQHGVDVHGALLALQPSLQGEEEGREGGKQSDLSGSFSSWACLAVKKISFQPC